ncbi:hypothetical protein ABEB36_011444 [Hypothenemus hampei]|uniref:Chitin-binding type-2 domain-containing protein n=1 Tax=Hypothenemus hampei TaxID=57062 RepID=A0ABD1EFH1_HYPHA
MVSTSLLVFALLLFGLVEGQRKVVRPLPIAPDTKEREKANFDCPEEFGYYPHPSDCTQYYVCVFGGALLESCTGGLMYSHELQTCDWPRNVGCNGLEIVGGAQSSATSAQNGVSQNIRNRDRERTRDKEDVRVDSRVKYSLPPPPQPKAVVTTRGQPRQSQRETLKQQLYSEVEESLPPAEEIENDRQQRVYRGQPSVVGQVQRDRDGYRHTNFLPTYKDRGEKTGVISLGTQYSTTTSDLNEILTNDLTTTTKKRRKSKDQDLKPKASEDDEEIGKNDDEHTEEGQESEFNKESEEGNPKNTNHTTSYEYHSDEPDDEDLGPPPSFFEEKNKYADIVNPFEDPNFDFDRFLEKLGSTTTSSTTSTTTTTTFKPIIIPQVLEESRPVKIANEQEVLEITTRFNDFIVVPREDILDDAEIIRPATPAPEPIVKPVSEDLIDDYDEERGASNKKIYSSKINNPPATTTNSIPEYEYYWEEYEYPESNITETVKPPSRNNNSDVPSVKYSAKYNKEKRNKDDAFKEESTLNIHTTSRYNDSDKIESSSSSVPLNSSENVFTSTSSPTTTTTTTIRTTTTVKTKKTSNRKRTTTTTSTTKAPVQKQKRKPTKTNLFEHDSRQEQSAIVAKSEDKSEAVPQTVSTVPASAKPLNNASTNQYNNIQQNEQNQNNRYDPYYALYDEEAEIYKEVDFVPQNAYNNNNAPVVSTRGNNALTRPAQESTAKRGNVVYNNVNQDIYQQSSTVSDYTDNSYQDEDSAYRQTNKAPARTPSRGRGTSHYTNSVPIVSNEVTVNINRGAPAPRSRPTLKPSTSIVSKASEFIDIYKFPPQRPDPLYPQPQPDKTAAKCRKDVCLLPDCYCGGKEIPGDLPVEQVPQIVLLTFDDSVNDLNKGLYQDLFERGRVNPNGCPIAATFYVSHEWTDYSQVQNLYSDGHELASHTVSHSFGEQFSQKKWTREVAGQREILAAYGGVKMEDVRGMRAPFLSVGGNKMFKMLYDSNFTYDSSMPIYENKPPSWPYTLDYKLFHDCMIPPCPTRSYPGVWEVPMVMWQDLNGGRCSMGDACSNPPDADGVFKMLLKNFQRHYTTNRAPFGLFYHAAWFTQPHHKEGFINFIDTILTMKDVWLVTNWQAIQWVRDPTPISKLNNFKPFQCDYSDRPKRCNNPKVCNLWHKSGVRYMRTCQPCPDIYPWTGNTGIRSSRIDNDIED